MGAGDAGLTGVCKLLACRGHLVLTGLGAGAHVHDCFVSSVHSLTHGTCACTDTQEDLAPDELISVARLLVVYSEQFGAPYNADQANEVRWRPHPIANTF